MTQQESDALAAPYEQCMIANGYSKTNAQDSAAQAKANAVCDSKLPLPPWEYDASNPHASDFVHAVVQCLRSKGVKYVEEGNPVDGEYGIKLGGPGNDSDSISKGTRLKPECEKEVAAKGIGR